MDSFISSLLYPKLHPVRRHVHSSHLGGTLLLLHQLTDFNETFRYIFLTQCRGVRRGGSRGGRTRRAPPPPPKIEKIRFFGVKS